MASTDTEGLTFGGLVASGTLATSQYKLVKLASTAGAVVIGSAATDKVWPLLNDPADGEEALIQLNGVAKVLGEASVTLGDYVMCSTTGRAKTTTTANDDVFGIALDTTAAAGDLIRVMLAHFNY